MQPKTKRIRGAKLQEIRKRIFAKQPLCVHCQQQGRVTEAEELDHVVPLHKGGTNHPSNMAGLCHDCHVLKSLKERGITKPRPREAKGLDW
jgi:5-methylcytosine-specific restriction protein A